jgi:hypothetical protein
MRGVHFALVAVLAAIALAVVGCGGGNDESAGTLEIKDLSSIHNFHLTGPGVDVSSDVGETEDENYDITLQDGTYNYVCDPHASQMNGSFTVSG